MFDALLNSMESELNTALTVAVMGFVATARIRLEDAVAKGLAEVAIERASALAEVDTRRRELSREIQAMQMHQEKQEGQVELNIGGYRRVRADAGRVPHTFFHAYFSRRYTQEVCTDGSIFVDRCGEHFGHVLE